MKNLLLIAHAPSKNTQTLANSLHQGALCSQAGVNITFESPFKIDQFALNSADGVILFTTENFGYMSGALKDMFDRTYYDVIDSKRGTPYCLVVRAGKDGTGCIRSVESIATGLGWKRVQAPLLFQGDYQRDRFNNDAYSLAQGFAEALAEGMI